MVHLNRALTSGGVLIFMVTWRFHWKRFRTIPCHRWQPWLCAPPMQVAFALLFLTCQVHDDVVSQHKSWTLFSFYRVLQLFILSLVPRFCRPHFVDILGRMRPSSSHCAILVLLLCVIMPKVIFYKNNLRVDHRHRTFVPIVWGNLTERTASGCPSISINLAKHCCQLLWNWLHSPFTFFIFRKHLEFIEHVFSGIIPTRVIGFFLLYDMANHCIRAEILGAQDYTQTVL